MSIVRCGYPDKKLFTNIGTVFLFYMKKNSIQVGRKAVFSFSWEASCFL